MVYIKRQVCQVLSYPYVDYAGHAGLSHKLTKNAVPRCGLLRRFILVDLADSMAHAHPDSRGAGLGFRVQSWAQCIIKVGPEALCGVRVPGLIRPQKFALGPGILGISRCSLEGLKSFLIAQAAEPPPSN